MVLGTMIHECEVKSTDGLGVLRFCEPNIPRPCNIPRTSKPFVLFSSTRPLKFTLGRIQTQNVKEQNKNKKSKIKMYHKSQKQVCNHFISMGNLNVLTLTVGRNFWSLAHMALSCILGSGYSLSCILGRIVNRELPIKGLLIHYPVS